jgi:Zn finger protein HypA/HybF involved in hydrogenase expression
MTRKTKQPRLLPRLEPIAETDALTLADLTTRYRCRCGNTAETAIKLDAVICTRCGNAMLPITTHERKRNDERNRPND